MENFKEDITQNIGLNNDELDLYSLFRIINRGKKLIFSIVISSTFLSTLYAFNVKPQWSGSFNIVVKENANDNSSSNSLGGYGSFFNNIIKTKDEDETQRLILKSPSVLMPVFEFVKKYYKSKNINTDKLFFKSWVENNLKIDFEDSTSVLKVEYINEDRELILKTLDLISSKYKAYSKRDTEKQITKTIKYLEEQTKLMKNKSLKSMRDFNEFSIKNGLGSIDGFVGIGQSSFQGNFNSMEMQQQLQQNNPDILIGQQKTLSNSGAGMRFNNQFKMLEEYEANFIDLSSKLKPNSTILKELGQRIDNLREALKRPNEILVEYRKLNMEAARNENILQDLENSLQILQLNKIKNPDPWEMISVPTIENKPVFPKKRNFAFGGFIISLIFGSLFCILKENLSGKIYELDVYKRNIKYKYLDTIYKTKININKNIIRNIVNTNDSIAIIKLSDNFFENSKPTNIEVFNYFKNLTIIDINKIDNLNSFKSIILVTEEGAITKENLTLIEKFLLPYKNEIIGWLYLI